MSEVVEIYSARGDQKIRDGALDYSQSITTRNEAEADAHARCKRDRTIRKVAYYVVRDDGSFRTLYSHDNPDALTIRKRGPRRQMADTLPRGTGRAPAKKKRSKAPLMKKLVDALKE